MQTPNYYSPLEERINISSHAIGLVLSVVALVFLIKRAVEYGSTQHVVSFGIFGGSLIMLYAASVAYHSAKSPPLRGRLRVLDHAAIYVLIAGTYTPFTLITLAGTTGWVLFSVAWGMALAGIILKLFFTGRYNLLSTLMYVLMGWIIVFAIKPLADSLSRDGLLWLLAGGLAYTIGAGTYALKSVKMNHAIFHVCVVAGSACHVVAVLFYVLPNRPV